MTLEFVCGDFQSSLCVWGVTEEEGGKVDDRLQWGSTDQLATRSAKITDAIGLDGMQWRLLQHGIAIHKTVSTTESVDEDEDENEE